MEHGAWTRWVGGTLLATALLAACSDDEPTAEPEPTPSPTAVVKYDAKLPPAAAVMALVPQDAVTLAVTDFDQVRNELGMDTLTGHSTPADVAAFWQQADQDRPLLSPGMLRPDEQQLAERYGFTQVDVAWEAHFFDADDHEDGWVLQFRDGTDLAQVARATQDPSTPVSGGTVDQATSLVSSGTTADPGQSWATDPALVALVGEPVSATYVSRACVPAGPSGTAAVDELGSYSVELAGSLATARLGAGRRDLFDRLDLDASDPEFTAAYAGGVADPTTGRLGFEMADPTAAAKLAMQHRLPFATCA